MAHEKMIPCPHCNGTGQVRENFSDRLQHAREVAKMTQAELSQAVGISRPQIANLESGRGDASVPVLIGLSGVLNVSIDWLLTGKESTHG